MIKGLAGGVGIKITGGDTSVPYINMNTEIPMQGMIRVWGTDLQVFGGTGWMKVPSSYATATLDEYTLELLDWAKKKKMEEEVLLSLPNDHLSVKLARQNVNRAQQELARAKEQLKITEILSQDEKATS